jgi:hypothetical protein
MTTERRPAIELVIKREELVAKLAAQHAEGKAQKEGSTKNTRWRAFTEASDGRFSA